MKSDQTIIRKTLMEQFNFITNLLGIKDPNITILNILYEHYQLLFFHFQEKQAEHFFGLIEDKIASLNPIFQTILKTF